MPSTSNVHRDGHTPLHRAEIMCLPRHLPQTSIRRIEGPNLPDFNCGHWLNC